VRHLNVDPLDSPSIPQLPPVSLRLHGGGDAPGRARRAVLSALGGHLPRSGQADLGLVVSELVTNSVCHAKVGSQQTLTVECAAVADRLRVTVTDPGSELQPRRRVPDQLAGGGRGLQIVEALSCAWGVKRDPGGTTSVWCELALSGAPDTVGAIRPKREPG
jgi:anti-sigma regulatory factor (Ser/Thr protein kinase)